MNLIRKYTAIKLGKCTKNDEVEVTLSYGEITGPYYNREYPQEEFDTEDQAYEYAYKVDKYATWLIIPIISFRQWN